MLTLAAERFDRSLTGELSRFRVEVAGEVARLRIDLSKGLSDIRQDVSEARVDLFKWSVLFWIGQVAAVAGLLAFMLRPA